MKSVIRVDEFALPEAEIRQELLAEAQQKPVQHLLQVDVWQHVAPENDLAVIPDDDGDCLTITERLELRRFEGVRVQVFSSVDFLRRTSHLTHQKEQKRPCRLLHVLSH